MSLIVAAIALIISILVFMNTNKSWKVNNYVNAISWLEDKEISDLMNKIADESTKFDYNEKNRVVKFGDKDISYKLDRYFFTLDTIIQLSTELKAIDDKLLTGLKKDIEKMYKIPQIKSYISQDGKEGYFKYLYDYCEKM